MGGNKGNVRLARVITLAIAQAVVVAVVIALGSASTGGAPPLAYVAAMLSGAFVIVSYRLPVFALVASIATVVVYYMLDLPPIGVAVPILAAAYLTSTAGKALFAVLSGGAFVVMSVLFRVAEGGESNSLLAYDTVTNLALLGAAVAVAAMQRAQWATARQQARVLDLERMAADQRVDRERLHISRELHDNLGHRLAITAVYANIAAEARDDLVRTSALRQVLDSTRGALEELRSTVRAIREGSETIADADFQVSAERLATALRDAGLTVSVSVAPANLPPRLAHAVTRVLQEAVGNIIRHSAAREAAIGLREDDGELVLTVTSDGAVGAFQPGRGILGMTQRANEVDGRLRVEGDEHGFVVELHVPLAAL